MKKTFDLSAFVTLKEVAVKFNVYVPGTLFKGTIAGIDCDKESMIISFDCGSAGTHKVRSKFTVSEKVQEDGTVSRFVQAESYLLNPMLKQAGVAILASTVWEKLEAVAELTDKEFILIINEDCYPSIYDPKRTAKDTNVNTSTNTAATPAVKKPRPGSGK